MYSKVARGGNGPRIRFELSSLIAPFLGTVAESNQMCVSAARSRRRMSVREIISFFFFFYLFRIGTEICFGVKFAR